MENSTNCWKTYPSTNLKQLEYKFKDTIKYTDNAFNDFLKTCAEFTCVVRYPFPPSRTNHTLHPNQVSKTGFPLVPTTQTENVNRSSASTGISYKLFNTFNKHKCTYQ